jgi:hypothetical protein
LRGMLAARRPALYFVMAIGCFYELWLEWPQVIGLLYLLTAIALSPSRPGEPLMTCVGVKG